MDTTSVATALGTWSVYPDPPRVIQRASKKKVFQYLMVFVLIWQGGGAQDAKKAAITTAALFGLTTALDAVFTEE